MYAMIMNLLHNCFNNQEIFEANGTVKAIKDAVQ